MKQAVPDMNKSLDAIVFDVVPLSFYYHDICDEIESLLGQWIQIERKRRLMTQRQLADRLFVSPSSVSQMERGRVFRNMDLFFRICNLFEWFAGDLLKASHHTCLSRHYTLLQNQQEASEND